MPFTEKRLAGPTQLTTSASAIYTVPANRTTIVKQIVATNTSASAATFTLYIGTATAANAVFSATSVAANDSLVINLSQVLSTGEVLRALASANTAINLTISGVENDGPLTPTATYIADESVTSAKIADGTIMNVDINASAAIDKTKISGTAITAADTGTVTSAMILDGTIATADIANNAITQAKLDTAVPLSGMRNLIINGNMSVAQRGGTITTSNGYSLDRWHVNSGANATITQSTDAAGATGNSLYSLKAVASGTQQIFVRQAIETLNAIQFAGKTVILSAFAAGISSTTNLNMSLAWSASTDNSVTGTWTDITPTSGGNLTLSGTMTRFTGVFAVPSTAKSLRVQFVNNAANFTANQGFYLGDVQLEVGSQVTPFEQRPIGTEMSLCQRYYYMAARGNALTVMAASYFQSTNFYGVITFPVAMRIPPALDATNGTNHFGMNSNGASDFVDTFNQWLRVTETRGLLGITVNAAGTAGFGGDVYTNNASAYIGFTAEL